MANPPAHTECDNCGAPRNPGLVACSFCDCPYPGAPRGVDCPRCGDDNLTHLAACASCGESLVRGCIFCGAASSIVVASCWRCGEAFEGAAGRKAARDAQARQQQVMGLAQSGLSMLGQAAKSPAAQGVLQGVWNDLLRSAVKKP